MPSFIWQDTVEVILGPSSSATEDVPVSNVLNGQLVLLGSLAIDAATSEDAIHAHTKNKGTGSLSFSGNVSR